MKQKFYSLLLTTLLGMTGMNAWAQDYEITCAQDLADFATAVNAGETTANAVLTDDIDMSELTEWTAIGDWHADNPYKGHFDGQGHTIKNFSFTSTHNYYGIFGVVAAGGVVENFTIYGDMQLAHKTGGVVGYTKETSTTVRNIHSYLNLTCTGATSAPRPGGVVGSAVNGTTNVVNCTYSGTLDVNGNTGNIGGIVGYVNNNASAIVNITNCLFDGTITNNLTADGQCGGIVGYNNGGTVTIKNCLSIGSITAKSDDIGMFFGRLNGSNSTFANNYYVGNYVNGTASGKSAKGTAPVKVTSAQLASGEIAFGLNESVSGGENWFQKLTTDNAQYVVTMNGDILPSKTANVIFEDNIGGTKDFVLPNFTLYTHSLEIPVGDIRFEDVEIQSDGTFNKTGKFTVDAANIPPSYAILANYLKDIDYKLNGRVDDGDYIWATVDEIAITTPLGNFNISIVVTPIYPTPYGTDRIYANGSFNCDMTPKEGTSVIYSNADNSVIDPHDFADGLCTVCGALDETYMAANGDGFFEIGTPAQLKWFATYVNTKDFAANAILVDDIDMTGVEWTPMGFGSGNVPPGATAYTGTFDGQGKAIIGFYAEGAGHLGLFGDTKGATIKNFSISGTLKVTSGYGGGVVAWPANTTIENVYSNLVVSVPNTDTHHVGGVVGSARGGNTISGCSFTGSLTVVSSTDNFAGIAAYITNGDKVINCGNFGSFTFSASGCAAGGIAGYVNAQEATIQNCLSIGQITFDGEGTAKYGAAIIGRTKDFSTDLVKNNYWLEGTAYGTIHNNDGSEAMTTGSVTAEQLASGEVAYKLGAVWSQFLGTDATPMLGSNTPVSYIGEAGYATMYDTANDWALNGDATAYIAYLNGTFLQLDAIADIPAGTPVILKGTYYNKLATSATSDVSANELLGTDTDTAADGTMYILAQVEGKVGFYKATGTIPAGKAYYQNSSLGVKAFYFAEDDATCIKNLKDAKDTEVFNLAGQRMSKMQKGINIVAGKKVLY